MENNSSSLLKGILKFFNSMLIIGLVFSVAFLAIVPLHSSIARSSYFIRSAVMVFLLCFILTPKMYFEQVEMYHSVFSYSSVGVLIDCLLFVVSALALVCLGTQFYDNIKPEYTLILIFCALGASMMISANDLISIYIALELQSFSLYLIACLRIDLSSSTHASLKYFLLGAMSSAFILLGISLVYQQVGSTNFNHLNAYMETVQVGLGGQEEGFSHFLDEHLVLILGLLSILCGCIFKISAAPFHS